MVASVVGGNEVNVVQVVAVAVIVAVAVVVVVVDDNIAMISRFAMSKKLVTMSGSMWALASSTR